MNKTDLLLQMMEHPQAYSADEWQQILLDDECRELYTLMSKTRSAIDAARAEEQITDQVIDEEWQRLCATAYPAAQHKSRFSVLNSQFRKIAASVIGVLIVSGIAFAAIHIARQHQEQKAAEVADTTAAANSSSFTLHPSLTEDTVAMQPVIYDNIPLEKMLPEIAAHYDVKVTFANEEVREFRFRFVWNPQQGIEQVVSDLNQFERLKVTLRDKEITVE